MKVGAFAGSALLCGDQSELGGGPLSRLTRIMGLDDRFCPVTWKLGPLPRTKRAAQKRAGEFITQEAWRVIVMLGRKAAAAFFHEGPFFTGALDRLGRVPLVSLPPPSSSEWRDHLVHRARELLREAAPDLPWGVFDDPLARLAYVIRLEAEDTFWAAAVPADLRRKPLWDAGDLMVALDAAEEHGLPRVYGERLVARYRAFNAIGAVGAAA